MLNLHFANHAETLAALLLRQLDRPRADAAALFTPDVVVVPSAAVQRWLTLAVAREHGVCAQLQFSYLGPWLWAQVARLRPDAPGSAPLSPAAQAWRVYAALGDARFTAQHPRLGRYLHSADAVMRFELAQRLAMLLEQYSTYRPDWLDAWRAGRPLPLAAGAAPHADEAWQAALWRRLDDDLDALPGGGAPDPATGAAARRQRGGGQAVADCTRWLATPAGAARAALAGLPARLQVFGLPTLPPLHLALLQQLARWVDVQVYAINPCREFWFDVVDSRRLGQLALQGQAQHLEVGHPLLASWGRQAQATLGQWVDAAGGGEGDAVVDDSHYTEPAPALELELDDALAAPADGGPHGAAPGHPPPTPPTLLARLQQSILTLTPLAAGSVQLAADDRSIELHVCHGRVRELEVLQDRLLSLLAGPSPPLPGEILVVTPDLDATAPLVDAVFGSAPPERFIPYTLTGLAVSQSSAPARALLDALALAGGRLPASAVFALLQQPVVARRFNLDDDGLARVHGWLHDAGVHWALDADHRHALGLPAQGRHSWADGLARLFLGHALPRVVSEPWAGLLPAGDAEGGDAADLGALWRFVQALTALTSAVAQPLPPARWPALLADTVAALVAPADADLEPLRELHAALQQLGTQLGESGLAEALPLDVVLAALTALLDDPARGGVPTGAVTFSAMSSLRGLPYRVICVLGLDDGAFPSAARPAEFDLLAAAPRPGDRQRRLDDRNLFLDLLLAARDTLHLSHTGRSTHDNSALPPSVLVAELLDQLLPALAPPGAAAHRAAPPVSPLAAARQRLVVQHPLQAFSDMAFRSDGDPRLRSHQADYAQALRTAAAAHAAAAAAGAGPASPAHAEAGTGHAEPTEPDPPDDDSSAADDDDRSDDPALAPFFPQPLPAPDAHWQRVSLDQLVAFFRQPSRYLLRQRLGLQLARPDDELQDDEPFLPDWLAQQALADRLLSPLLAGVPAAQVQALAQAGTELPAGAFGARTLALALGRLQQHAARVINATRAPCLPPVDASLTLDVDGQHWQIDAGFADLRASGLLRHRADLRRPADHLTAWLHHLLLCAARPAGVALRTRWLMQDGVIGYTECDAPRAVLTELLRLYASGLREPLRFFPKSSWAYVVGGDNAGAASRSWTPSARTPFAEGADAAHRLAWRGRPDPVNADDGRLAHIAHTVFDPLLACLVDGPGTGTGQGDTTENPPA